MKAEDLKKYMDREVWYRIIERDILDCGNFLNGERFDSLKILSVYTEMRKKERVMIVNYRLDVNENSTEFGHIEAKAEDLEAMFREDRINQIIL